MTPYEKWMRNEEVKNRGSMGEGQMTNQDNPMHASKSGARRPSAMQEIDNGGYNDEPPPPGRRPSRGGPPPPQDGYDDYEQYPEQQMQPHSTHNPMASGGRRPSRGGPPQEYYDDGQLDQPAPGGYDNNDDTYAEHAFEEDFSQSPSMAAGGYRGGPGPGPSPGSRGPPMSPGQMQGGQGSTMRRPSAARNPLRSGGPAGRRGSAISGASGGRPTSDAAAAFMARKKRQSTR